MRRKRSNDEGGGPNWLDTYADMVTLLLTFFILLFSISSVNAEKWAAVVESFSENIGTQTHAASSGGSGAGAGDESTSNESENTPAIDDAGTQSFIPESPEDIQKFDQLYYYLKKYVDDNDLTYSIELLNGDGYTFIIFRDNIFFDGDSSVLKEEGKKILSVLAEAISPINEQIGSMKFEGHTARAGNENVPNSIYGDWQLSADRAVNVLTYIYSRSVINPSKLSAVGNGEHSPIVPHDGTEETRRKNRRVEIYISEDGKDEVSLDKIYTEKQEQENVSDN